MPLVPQSYPHVRQFETPWLRRERALASTTLLPERPSRRRWRLVLRQQPACS